MEHPHNKVENFGLSDFTKQKFFCKQELPQGKMVMNDINIKSLHILSGKCRDINVIFEIACIQHETLIV